MQLQTILQNLRDYYRDMDLIECSVREDFVLTAIENLSDAVATEVPEASFDAQAQWGTFNKTCTGVQ